MQTPDPVVVAAHRAGELYDLFIRLETEEGQLKRGMETVAGDTEPNREMIQQGYKAA